LVNIPIETPQPYSATAPELDVATNTADERSAIRHRVRRTRADCANLSYSSPKRDVSLRAFSEHR
jgi:hypothetical protein